MKHEWNEHQYPEPIVSDRALTQVYSDQRVFFATEKVLMPEWAVKRVDLMAQLNNSLWR